MGIHVTTGYLISRITWVGYSFSANTGGLVKTVRYPWTSQMIISKACLGIESTRIIAGQVLREFHCGIKLLQSLAKR